MTYIVKMRGGDEFEITEQERTELLKTAEGSVYLKSLDVSLNVELIATTYPKSIADAKEDRRYQMTGFLHDGTRVKRHFGEWVLANQETVDDNGHGVPIKIDPKYYPEVSHDCVPTELEWNEKYKIISEKQRLGIILQDYEAPRISSGLNHISKLLENKAS